MLQTIITCDVCKTEDRGPYPKEVPGKYWKGEVAGGRWYKLAIYVDSATEGAAISDVTIDVCPECAEKLVSDLGMGELPPVIEDEEEGGGGLTITSPFDWKDDSSVWTTHITANTNTVDFTAWPWPSV